MLRRLNLFNKGSSKVDEISERYVSVQAFLVRHSIDKGAIRVSCVEQDVENESLANEVLDYYVSAQAFLARHNVDDGAIQVLYVEQDVENESRADCP